MADREQIAAEEGMGGLTGRWGIDAGPALSRRASELLIGADTIENDREKWVVRR